MLTRLNSTLEYRGTTHLSKDAVLDAIGFMPTERGTDFYSGVMVGNAINRTYTRVDGDRFQISRNAGMNTPLGAAVVCSGRVSEDGGKTIIYTRFTAGVIPVALWLWLAAASLLAAIFVSLTFSPVDALILFLAPVPLVAFYSFKRWEQRWLRSVLSERLGGVDWDIDRR